MKHISHYIRKFFSFRGRGWKLIHFDPNQFEGIVVQVSVDKGWETLACNSNNKITTTMLAHRELSEYPVCWN